MPHPLISIITTVYNADATLEDTIKSVLSQESGLFEYWIIDGGSSDRSIDIIRKYEDKLAGWVSESDKGIYDAMNKAIDRSDGYWLYFLGADDILCTDTIKNIKYYLQPSLAVVYGNVKYDTGHLYKSSINARCLLENRLHHQSAFYNRSLFYEFRYNQKFSICADYELTLRIYLRKLPSLYIPITIALFATGGASHILTSSDINAIRKIYIKIPLLNSFFSFIINNYYSFVRLKNRLKNNLKKMLIAE